MHNNLGEINYGKITGKVYLVEENSDGYYGKFVEANGVTSDEDAVAKWKNGQATAKDFTKENVTLKEGDTILVMDRDTYAHGSGTRAVNIAEYRREFLRNLHIIILKVLIEQKGFQGSRLMPFGCNR